MRSNNSKMEIWVTVDHSMITLMRAVFLFLFFYCVWLWNIDMNHKYCELKDIYVVNMSVYDLFFLNFTQEWKVGTRVHIFEMVGMQSREQVYELRLWITIQTQIVLSLHIYFRSKCRHLAWCAFCKGAILFLTLTSGDFHPVLIEMGDWSLDPERFERLKRCCCL